MKQEDFDAAMVNILRNCAQAVYDHMVRNNLDVSQVRHIIDEAQLDDNIAEMVEALFE